ncbi:gibberellin 2-beta-dioxygenase 3-like [Lolium rigidum]|uniref:gibberellin 2-beta-dioxygenase 3-like n=1 Tax=Lolium rigidum TaxID=89674 RepID=UPI001F5DA5C8|nr:gibberellin 2-beta-dioxygenase 3-like [Lolium rigidum]
MVAIAVPCTIDQIPLVKCPKAANVAVPTIDMSAPGAAAAVADACRGVGFFRATNHGVPAALTDVLEARAAAFFALPHEDKLEHASARPFGYGSKTIGPNGDVGWLEYLLLSVGSSTIQASSLPPSLRAVLEEYTVAVISVLRSNRTGGLQIMLRDSRWVPVAPDPDSLFVNVGDALQVLTNGRFRSVKHQVVAPEAGKESRLSVIYFGGPAATQRIAPLPELMRDGEQSLYREFTWGEYKKAAYKTRLADHRLGPFELPAAGKEPTNADHHHCSSSSKGVQPAPPNVARVH